jgi:hypothetical protein
MKTSRFPLALLIVVLIAGVGASAFWAGHARSGGSSLEFKTYQPGWASVPWLDDTMPIEAALSSIADSVGVVYYLDPDTGGWKRYIPGRPEVSNLAMMGFGQSYLLLLTKPVTLAVATQPGDLCPSCPMPTQCPAQVIDQQDLDEVCGLIDDIVSANDDLQWAWGPSLLVKIMFDDDFSVSDWSPTDFAVGDVDQAALSLRMWAAVQCD